MEIFKAYAGIAFAGLFFILLLSLLLVIIDHKSRMQGERVKDRWSIRGERRDHPAWAWMVSVILWVIVGSIFIGTLHRNLTGGHGGSHASATAAFASEDTGHRTESALLKRVKQETIFDRKAHFHNLVDDPTEEGKQPVCYYCHGSFPHKRQPMIRTLLNMHTQFVGCMTCHVEDIPEEELKVDWYNYSGIQPKGGPFGLDYNPETGALEDTDDYYSKITVFVTERGELEPLEIPEDEPRAKEFIKVRGELTPEEQGRVKNLFHTNVAPKGRFCTRCHRTEGGLIPFKKLGFSEQRVRDLTGLNIVSITQKYKKFYIPSIFRDETSKERADKILGKEEETPEIAPSQLRDPRYWWKQKYSE